MSRKDRLEKFIIRKQSADRTSSLKKFVKLAQSEQSGIFQNFQSGVTNFDTREGRSSGRGGEPVDRDSLYGLSPEHEDSKPTNRYIAPHLSTRYVPGKPGVQGQHVGDGVIKDPYTNKLYDYNEGFKTEDGKEFPGGDPSLQTDLISFSSHLKRLGLKKESAFLKSLIEK